VRVDVGVAVRVGVDVTVGVRVAVAVRVGVRVGVTSGIGVSFEEPTSRGSSGLPALGLPCAKAVTRANTLT
jgi:hypothetical protein